MLARNSKPGPKNKEQRTKLNGAYAFSMETVYNSFPDNSDVAALFAESMMNVWPWKLWVKGKMREADENFQEQMIKEEIEECVRVHAHTGKDANRTVVTL